MDKSELLEIRKIIEDIKLKGLQANHIVKLYSLLGNKRIPLKFDSNALSPASFNPCFMNISVNLNRSIIWAESMLDSSKEYFNLYNPELIKAYLTVCMMAHEVEHSNQKLIADGVKKPNYAYKKQAYSDLYGVIMPKEYKTLKPIASFKDALRLTKYRIDEYNFILERNASIAGYNLASLVADACHDREALSYLISTRNAFLMQGYKDNRGGTLKHTYQKLGMMKEYNRLQIDDNISLDERIKEGLELSEDERNVSLLLLRSSMKFKQKKQL